MIVTRADLLDCQAWAHMDADSSGNPCVWRNLYACDCSEGLRCAWESDWSCQCDDECPVCGASVSPVESVWIGPSTALARAFWECLPESGGEAST